MDKNRHVISNQIQAWYKQHKRELPWRKTKDPYKIWVSEVVLQQTRVAQGTAYYLRFVEAFPDVKTLADASEDKVLKLWQGLGYYSRARNMHAAARHVVESFNGVFPNNYQDLLSLKGVGPYTAAAISSITCNEAVAVVDGNVERVLSRLFEVKVPVNETIGKKEIVKIAESVLDRENAGDHNQAMMEIGALICTPKNLKCTECPLQNNCLSYEKGSQEVLPIKTKKTKQRKRYFNYFLLANKEYAFIKKRDPGDIWAGLYELVLLETDMLIDTDMALQMIETKFGLSSSQYVIQEQEVSYKHILSHQTIHAIFITLMLLDTINIDLPLYEKVSLNKVLSLPVSRLTDRFFKENSLFG